MIPTIPPIPKIPDDCTLISKRSNITPATINRTPTIFTGRCENAKKANNNEIVPNTPAKPMPGEENSAIIP